MRHRRSIAVLAFIALAIGSPAHACRMTAPIVLADVKFAELVVVGRIAHYEIVRDNEFRRKMLANPKLPPADRKFYTGRNQLMVDYARFDVLVDEVVFGRAAKRFRVTWYNSTFGTPEKMPAGPFLIALSRPGAKQPPLRGPSATIQANAEPGTLTMLQAPCSSPFLFESNSDQARAVRKILNDRAG